MTLLSIIDKKRINYRLVGVSLPLPIVSYLALYSLAKGITKSRLFKNLIDSWILKQRAKGNDFALIREVSRKVTDEWARQKSRNSALLFTDFKTMLEIELLNKGIENEQVMLILNGIKE